MSDEALGEPMTHGEQCEKLTGGNPGALRESALVALPKPAGGYEPIGLMAGFP